MFTLNVFEQQHVREFGPALSDRTRPLNCRQWPLNSGQAKQIYSFFFLPALVEDDLKMSSCVLTMYDRPSVRILNASEIPILFKLCRCCVYGLQMCLRYYLDIIAK